MQNLNYKMLIYTLGMIALIEAGFMCIPFVMSLAAGDVARTGFGVTLLILASSGALCMIAKPVNRHLQAKDGFVIVAMSWIIMSLTGALPFVISREIPSYVDALFETVSGFTTTGSTILTGDMIDNMPHSLLLWRSLTQWMGGMGVLVFVIAILPKADGEIIHLFRAEVPGPEAGKLVSKLRNSARILYAIYVALTVLEIIVLSVKMPFFDAVINSLSTASTGGFSCHSDSILHYHSLYVEIAMSVFMYLFALNFTLFYLLLMRRFKEVFADEEFLTFTGIVVVAMFAIALDLYYTNGGTYETFGECLRHSSFNTLTIISTAGFGTVDFTTWPIFSQALIFVLMFFGGCAGSTAGGLKMSRVIIITKSGTQEIRKSMNPRSINVIRFNRQPLDASVVHGVQRYFLLYIVLFIISVLLVSISNVRGGFTGINESVTAVTSAINNVGPGLGALGPYCNYSTTSVFTKLVLILDMLAGRLEILPLMILFVPKTWRK